MSDHYTRALISFASQQAEWVGYLAMERGAQGLEELDTEGERTQAWLYFDDDPGAGFFADLDPQVPGGLELIRTESNERENWQANWKEHFKPLPVGERFLVRPPWEASVDDRLEIVIDPGQGFGTGYHETTRLALCLLEKLEGKLVGPVIDVGFGSGILTIGALLLGAKGAICLEIEKEALDELPLNLQHSGLDPGLAEGRLHGPEVCHGSAPLVIANITGDVLLEMQKDLKRMAEDYLLLSGIAPDYVAPIKEAFADLELLESSSEGDWTALLYRQL